MCLAVLALNTVPGIPVVIAANRDEYHARPTDAAAQWPDAPQVIAGRDRQSGGTWMGMTPTGRFAFVTNFRDPLHVLADAPSRGGLVKDFLRASMPPAEYIAALEPAGERYNGFSLVVGDADTTWYYSNRGGPPQALRHGIYALSNHLLDTPWPKLSRLKAAFSEVLRHAPAPDVQGLLEALADRTPSADCELPDTGVGIERERFLSSPFIVGPAYGTRSSSVMMLGAAHCTLHEVRFAPDGSQIGRSDLRFERLDGYEDCSEDPIHIRVPSNEERNRVLGEE